MRAVHVLFSHITPPLITPPALFLRGYTSRAWVQHHQSALKTDLVNEEGSIKSKMTPRIADGMSSPSTREEEPLANSASSGDEKETKKRFPTIIVWNNVMKFAVLHLLGLHALVLLPVVMPQTVAFSILCFLLGGLVSKLKRIFMVSYDERGKSAIVTVST